MRRVFIILAVLAAMSLGSVSTAFAQWGWRGARRAYYGGYYRPYRRWGGYYGAYPYYGGYGYGLGYGGYGYGYGYPYGGYVGVGGLYGPGIGVYW
ncbi:MAG TPA: hypothetical protein VHB77_22525 [Planctomycetaceae bacterium]|nr:hypothetical protein [Planctomycetaceae bacterium]